MAMDTIVEQSMVLVHILPIIQNRFSWHVLFRVGVRSRSLVLHCAICPLTSLNRCDANWKDLDSNAGGRRSHELTNALFDALG